MSDCKTKHQWLDGQSADPFELATAAYNARAAISRVREFTTFSDEEEQAFDRVAVTLMLYAKDMLAEHSIAANPRHQRTALGPLDIPEPDYGANPSNKPA